MTYCSIYDIRLDGLQDFYTRITSATLQCAGKYLYINTAINSYVSISIVFGARSLLLFQLSGFNLVPFEILIDFNNVALPLLLLIYIIFNLVSFFLFFFKSFPFVIFICWSWLKDLFLITGNVSSFLVYSCLFYT